LTASSLNLSLLDKHEEAWGDEEDKLLLREEGYGNLCSSEQLFANTKYPSASDMNFNNNLFGWNEIVQSIILSEQQRATNLNTILCTAAMSVVIGMQPLSAFAHDSNNIISDVWNYQQGAVTTISNNNAIKSSSILSASTVSSELRVKINDAVTNKKPASESTSPLNSKLSMGVKVEYYPEEIEIKMQAERDQLERMAQVEQEEQQQKIDVVEREQQLLREKEQKELKMVEEKAAAASAAASVASSAATTSTTAKIVVQPTQQVPPPPTLPSVQIAENTKQQPQTPPSPKINTEKEELIKILRDTSTTSKITKEAPTALSQVADTNNDDVMMNEVDQKQLQLFQVVGVGALGAGLVNSINSKKEDEDDNNSSEGDNDPPLLPSSSTFEPSSPPLVKLKSPKPPSEPPIPPSDATLNKVLGLLEDDLQELNKNLELLENDLNELNTDLDSLQDEDGDSNLPSAGGASATSVSKGSYLDSLPGGNQFELKRSGTGFQSSYLARLGGAAPLQFDYSDTTTKMAEDYALTSDDQTSDASSDVDQYQIDEGEELPPTTDVAASATAAVATGSYLDSLPDCNQSPTPPSFQSSNVPSAWRASAATVSKGSYLDSLPGGNQFELKRSGTGFQSSYLARLGGAAPLQFDYGDSSTTNAPSETDQHQNDEAKEIPSLPPPLPFPSSDEMSPTEANSQRQIIDTESGLPPTDIASASTVSAGSYLASLAGSNQPLQSSYLGGLGGYLDSLSGSNQFGLKRSGTAFQSSYLGGLRAGAAPLEFRYVGSSPTLEEDYTSNYDNVDQRSYASPETDQYQNNEAEALPPVPPPQSFSSSDATSSTTSNAQRQMFQTSTGKRMRIDTDVVSDVNVDRAAPPFLRQSPTRLQMFGIKHPRGRHSTRLYMSQQSDEEESLFPSTDALIEVLRRQKMEKDRRDAEYRAQQQQEQRLADEEQRAREEAEQRAREEEERLRLEQEAKEDAALQMQLQMRMMAAERKAEEDRMMEQVLMEQKTKEEEAEKLRLQKEEVERLADERRQREEEEAKLREWEEKEERLLLEEKAKEEAEMKEFEERLVIEQRAKEEAELRARREEEERLQSEQRARDEAKLKQQQHEEEMRSRREKEQLLQIEQNMSYLNDALAQVDDRLGALNNDQSEAEVEYLDIDEGIQYLNSAVSEIDSLLSEGDDGY